MTIDRLGGALVLASCVLLVGTAAAAIGGESVSIAGPSLGANVFTAALLLLASGAAILAVTAPAGLRSRAVRAGLGMLAGGIVTSTATANASASSYLIIVFLAGNVATLFGLATTALAFLSSSGRPRWIGFAFLAGLLLVIAAVVGANAAVGADGSPSKGLQGVTGVLAVFGAAAMVLAISGIGLIGVRPGLKGQDGPFA